MKKIISVSILMLSLFASSVFASAWQTMGTKTVTRHTDVDTIHVNRGKQNFKKLQLSVRGTAIDMDRMVVHFKNGGTEKVNVRDTIRAGGHSRVIDLPGNRRGIEKVVFWYDAKGLGRKNAVVTLMGR